MIVTGALFFSLTAIGSWSYRLNDPIWQRIVVGFIDVLPFTWWLCLGLRDYRAARLTLGRGRLQRGMSLWPYNFTVVAIAFLLVAISNLAYYFL